MSVTYTITLTEAQDKAFKTIAADPQEWIQNITSVRADEAIEGIVKSEIEKTLAAGGTISGTKDDIVLAADIKTVAELNAELEAARQAKLNAQ